MLPAHPGNKKRAMEDIQRYQSAFIQQWAVVGQALEFPHVVADNCGRIPKGRDGLNVTAYDLPHGVQGVGDLPHLAGFHRLHH